MLTFLELNTLTQNTLAETMSNARKTLTHHKLGLKTFGADLESQVD